MKRTSFVAAACVPAVFAVTMLAGVGVAQASELPRIASSVQDADGLVNDASDGVEEEDAGGLEVFDDITEHVSQVWAVGCDAAGYCPMELMDEREDVFDEQGALSLRGEGVGVATSRETPRPGSEFRIQATQDVMKLLALMQDEWKKGQSDLVAEGRRQAIENHWAQLELDIAVFREQFASDAKNGPRVSELMEEGFDQDLDGDGGVEAEEVVQVELAQLVYDFCVDNASGICEEVHEVIGVDAE